jgi:hypothetical protein
LQSVDAISEAILLAAVRRISFLLLSRGAEAGREEEEFDAGLFRTLRISGAEAVPQNHHVQSASTPKGRLEELPIAGISQQSADDAERLRKSAEVFSFMFSLCHF